VILRKGAVALLAAVALSSGVAAAQDREDPGERDVANAGIGAGRRTAIVRASERVGPAVVTVSILKTRLVQGRVSPRHEDFFWPFFRGFRRRFLQRVESLGSGLIVHGDGIVVTNYHVVEGAQQITITLADGREYNAHYLGGSDVYDLAVLELEAGDDSLPAAPLGSSRDLLIGEWVIAIGNPFGYLLDDPQPTVTVGVVSAKARDVHAETERTSAIYKDMIQTDAAINPGNSGGALVNALGDVVGINTFIISKSGGSQGMGFAIPIDTVRRVVDEILEHGHVREVWVGVQVNDIPQALAESLELESTDGVIVSSVDRGSPAEKAGIRARDVIRKIGRDTIRDLADARRALYGTLVEDKLDFVVQRGNDPPVTRTLTLVERRD
jgi:serine protease Do